MMVIRGAMVFFCWHPRYWEFSRIRRIGETGWRIGPLRIITPRIVHVRRMEMAVLNSIAAHLRATRGASWQDDARSLEELVATRE